MKASNVRALQPVQEDGLWFLRLVRRLAMSAAVMSKHRRFEKRSAEMSKHRRFEKRSAEMSKHRPLYVRRFRGVGEDFWVRS